MRCLKFPRIRQVAFCIHTLDILTCTKCKGFFAPTFLSSTSGSTTNSFSGDEFPDDVLFGFSCDTSIASVPVSVSGKRSSTADLFSFLAVFDLVALFLGKSVFGSMFFSSFLVRR